MVTESTHLRGHILDLILTHGVTINDIEIGDLSFSDHKPVMFNCSIVEQVVKDKKPIIWARVFKNTFAEDFSLCFNEIYSLENNSNIEQHLRQNLRQNHG